MNPDHVYRDPERGKGAGRLLRGEPESMANRRRSLTEISERRRLERAARESLDRCGWTAPTVVVSADLAGQGLKSTEIMSALQLVGEMRGQQDRPPTDEEIEMATTRTRETREAILALLREDPTLTSSQLWERCERQGVHLTARSSFENIHCSWARKQLGIDGSKHPSMRKPKPGSRKADTNPPAARATAPNPDQPAQPTAREAIRALLQEDPSFTDAEIAADLERRGIPCPHLEQMVSLVAVEMGIGADRPAPAPDPARQPSEEAEAAQPPEVDDEQPSPTPPPAVPVALDEGDPPIGECPECGQVADLSVPCPHPVIVPHGLPTEEVSGVEIRDATFSGSSTGAAAEVVRQRILSDLLAAEQKLRELKIALVVVEGLVA